MSQFEKFTERAKKVLTLAKDEAQLFNHNYIGTEHILLGLVREGDGIASRILEHHRLTLKRVRTAVSILVGRGEEPITGEIRLTERAKKVLELAVDDSRSFNHDFIGTEHLLLALAREGEGIAAGVVESLGVSLEAIRLDVFNFMGPVDAPSKESVIQFESTSNKVSATISIFDMFNEQARQVLSYSREEAVRFNHESVGPAHLLLGLVRDQSSVAVRILIKMDVPPTRVGLAVESLIGRGDLTRVKEIVLTPRAKQVLELSVDEARRLNHDYVGTEHLLLGLVREGGGIAAIVLNSYGVDLAKVRVEFKAISQDQK